MILLIIDFLMTCLYCTISYAVSLFHQVLQWNIVNCLKLGNQEKINSKKYSRICRGKGLFLHRQESSLDDPVN